MTSDKNLYKGVQLSTCKKKEKDFNRTFYVTIKQIFASANNPPWLVIIILTEN